METTVVADIVEMQCGECGVFFWITSTLQQERKRNGGVWYCPNGHERVYRKSDVDILKDQLAEAQRKLSASQFELMAAEKKVTRLEQRAKHGVCPCCHRQFVNMARHMKSKHPDFGQK